MLRVSLRSETHATDSVRRMDCEDRRDECALPRRERHPLQRKKQQTRAGEVQQHARHHVHPGLRAPEIDIQHVRHPRDRIPAERRRGDRPANRLRGQSVDDMRIFGDELAVVVVEKRMRGDLRENREHENGQAGDEWDRIRRHFFLLPLARH